MFSSRAAAILPCPAMTLKSRSMMTGLTKPNSRIEARSFAICSFECVRALFTYGISRSTGTSFISVVVFIAANSFLVHGSNQLSFPRPEQALHQIVLRVCSRVFGGAVLLDDLVYFVPEPVCLVHVVDADIDEGRRDRLAGRGML